VFATAAFEPVNRTL